jgi:Ca-activated chloride channel family protein
MVRVTTVSAAFVIAVLFAALVHAQAQPQQTGAADRPVIPGGELQVLGPGGAVRAACPLKHTDVVANVAGFVNRTRVKQTFHNPFPEKIEAVYVFPLPSDGAVDEMVMTVGDRRIVGQVKKREDARAVYEQAKSAGQVASLLDQERPNVFTQSVANIEPGVQVTIEIAYVETLKYDDGWFELSFPTVVGPRYMPGSPTGKQGEGWAPDTDKVPDASKISPPVTPPGTRTGHDISLTVNVDAGMEIRDVECRSHPVNTEKPAPGRLTVALKNENTIPNKDFILRYRTATDQVADALLTHKDGRGSFFTLILQPPQKVQRKDAVGRELIFVLDTSGSMQGFPVTQAKWVMARAIDGLGPQDTFNLITFSGDTSILWEEPRPNTPQNRDEAQKFLASREGRGGTEMMKAIHAALVKTRRAKPQAAGAAGGPEPIRIVCFMTDGYVGNDMQIIDAVKKNAGTTRVFSFGIGNSVNRYLLDGMAYAGRGEVEYVTLEAKSELAAKRFYERIDAPVLTDVALDFGNLPVADVYPKAIPDLFSNKPILVHGRLTGDVKPGATITLRGNNAGGAFERKVEVKPAPQDASHEALASLWARTKVSDLMMRDLAALQSGTFPENLKNEVTALGVEFKLMTQFTSFVAVEEMTVTKGGKPITIAVPVEMPDGVSYEGVFGERAGGVQPLATASASSGRGFGGGGFGGPALQQASRGRGVTMLYAQAAANAPAPAPAGATPAITGVAPADGTVTAGGASAGNGAAQQSQPQAGEQVLRRSAAGRQLERLEDKALAEADSDTVAGKPAAAPADPAAKLDESLRTLADKVAKEGKNGSLTAGGVTVTAYKADVMIYLSNTSPETLAALKKLGFEQSAESKAVRLVIGTIDVRKLLELAKLDAVVSVKPLAP